MLLRGQCTKAQLCLNVLVAGKSPAKRDLESAWALPTTDDTGSKSYKKRTPHASPAVLLIAIWKFVTILVCILYVVPVTKCDQCKISHYSKSEIITICINYLSQRGYGDNQSPLKSSAKWGLITQARENYFRTRDGSPF